MPMHVEEMRSEVGVFDGELPLSEAQVEKLIKITLARLERKQREARYRRDATAVRSQAAPPAHTEE